MGRGSRHPEPPPDTATMTKKGICLNDKVPNETLGRKSKRFLLVFPSKKVGDRIRILLRYDRTAFKI
jgi:hypothetical protein